MFGNTHTTRDRHVLALGIALLLLVACGSTGSPPTGTDTGTGTGQHEPASTASPSSSLSPSPPPATATPPQPTPTSAWPDDTPTPAPAPANTPTPALSTVTPAPPPPTPGPPTTPDTVLQNGQPWQASGWLLAVDGFAWDSFHDVRFTLRNQTGRVVLFPEISTEAFRITTDAGETFAPCSIRGSGWYNTVWHSLGQTELQPDETLVWEWEFHPYDPEHRACDNYSHSTPTLDARTRVLTLTVDTVGDVFGGAQWREEVPRP